MSTPHQQFEDLPEPLRLALLEHARRVAGVEGRPLTLSQISEIAEIPYEDTSKRFQAALLKLRRRALELEIEP